MARMRQLPSSQNHTSLATLRQHNRDLRSEIKRLQAEIKKLRGPGPTRAQMITDICKLVSDLKPEDYDPDKLSRRSAMIADSLPGFVEARHRHWEQRQDKQAPDL